MFKTQKHPFLVLSNMAKRNCSKSQSEFHVQNSKASILVAPKWPNAIVGSSDPLPWCICFSVCLFLSLVSHLPSISNFWYIWWLNSEYTLLQVLEKPLRSYLWRCKQISRNFHCYWLELYCSNIFLINTKEQLDAIMNLIFKLTYIHCQKVAWYITITFNKLLLIVTVI